MSTALALIRVLELISGAQRTKLAPAPEAQAYWQNLTLEV